MSNLENHTASSNSSILPDYRSSYQSSQGPSVAGSGVGSTTGSTSNASSIPGQAGIISSMQPPNQSGVQSTSSMSQRGSSSIPQSMQQVPSYYPEQSQQYQQMLNGNFNSSLQSQSQQTQQTQQQQQQPMVGQPYTSYYMFNQQNQQPQQQPQQHQQSGHTLQSGTADQTYAYGRYPYAAAPPSNYASLYQQSVPQMSSQMSQPQPQLYNQLGSAAMAYPASSTNSTSMQDTLNSASSSSVGQYQPPGIRPRVTTTMWEDEKTLCYQVDANNVSVVRRADNNMINGTKLLNVAQMTRGRRDGILKSEKVRHVVKIGSMHLKGVWIPFERALAMAQREGIVDLLYPLFVRDIKRVIQTGVTPSNGAAASAVAPKSGSTPTPSVAVNTSGSNSYYQYNQQYPQNGSSTTQQSSPQQKASAEIQQPQQPQQQIYGYQQPYYAPNQYYQSYNPNSNYSSYSNQPVYSGYGYMNQMPQAPQQVPQQVPQQSASNPNTSSASTRPMTSSTLLSSNSSNNPVNPAESSSTEHNSNGDSLVDKKSDKH